jgi:hypothetical protein
MFRENLHASSESSWKRVGWLGKGHTFPTGQVPAEFVEKLASLLTSNRGIIYTCGFHRCEFCRKHPRIGSRSLLVLSEEGIYHAPEGIIHYIATHHYRPPKVFIRAVLSCPDPDTPAWDELQQALLPKWKSGENQPERAGKRLPSEAANELSNETQAQLAEPGAAADWPRE